MTKWINLEDAKRQFEFCTKDMLGSWIAAMLDSLQAIEIDDNADKEGEWIGGRVRSYPGYTCSLCGYSVEPWNTTKGCPNCRAKMKGKAE